MTSSKAQKPRPIQRAEASIGGDLRTWRLLQRLTVQQVADRAGVSGRTVRRLEDGQGVSLENVLRVARALGVLEQLATALDPYESDVGRLRADESLPLRVRPRKSEK